MCCCWAMDWSMCPLVVLCLFFFWEGPLAGRVPQWLAAIADLRHVGLLCDLMPKVAGAFRALPSSQPSGRSLCKIVDAVCWTASAMDSRPSAQHLSILYTGAPANVARD